jgi:mercuric ion binding protein
MKQFITILTLFLMNFSFAQDKNARASMEVDGVCGMCKERIEKAAIKTKGVKSAVWTINTHQLDLIYDARKTDLDLISENIAAVGHDTKHIEATEEAYLSVHDCCRYRDDDVQQEHKDEGKN